MALNDVRARVTRIAVASLTAHSVLLSALLLAAAAGCQSNGSQVTGSDRPAEGVDWNVDEQMARDRGN